MIGLIGLCRQPALVEIGRQCVVAGTGETVGDPANLVVETPPLLNDDDPGPVMARHRQIALGRRAIRPGKVGHDTHRYPPDYAFAKAGMTFLVNSSTDRIASSWLIVPKAKSQT